MTRHRTSLYRRVICHGHPRQDHLGHVLEHVLTAERALGAYLPPSAEVHHVDGDGRNNTPSNLVICQDAAYHKLLHVRARIIRSGGNPNTDSICSRCLKVKPRSAFNRASRNKATGVQNACRSCQSIFFKEWAARKKSAKVAAKHAA